MRVLGIHQNFPGQFRQLAAHLSQRPGVQFLGLGRDTAPGIEGCRLLRYRLARRPASIQHPYLRKMESAVLHGQAVARVLEKLKRSGSAPDVIVAHPGWGETLYVRDVFPDVRLIHFAEWYYATLGDDTGFDPEFPASLDDRARVRTRNALHALNLDLCDVAVSPTQWQKSRHPAAYQDKIRLLHEGIDVASLGPNPVAALNMPNGTVLHAGQPVLTYVARNLEPYRGFHVFMRMLEKLQRMHPKLHTVIVGGDEVSYGAAPADSPSWRTKLLGELKLDASRTHFLGRLPYTVYKTVLQISAVHVYLTYPFVLSWSMLEAMASGCLVVASDTAPVRECIEHGVNGFLTPFFDQQAMAESLVRALSLSPSLRQGICNAARLSIRNRYSSAAGTAAYLDLIGLPTQAPASSSNLVFSPQPLQQPVLAAAPTDLSSPTK